MELEVSHRNLTFNEGTIVVKMDAYQILIL